MISRRRVIAGAGSFAVVSASRLATMSETGVSKQGSQSMQIKRSGDQPSQKGPEAWFTGQVRIDPLHTAVAPAHANVASVTFEPGARTAWHTHPLGQTLIVTAGAGRAQTWGGPIEELRPGDVVWFSRARSTGTARAPRRR